MKKPQIPASPGQMKDQTAKGALLGLIAYLATKNEIDAEILALSMPIISAVLAYVSSQVGDKDFASFFNK